MKKEEFMAEQGIEEAAEALTAVWQKQCGGSGCDRACCNGQAGVPTEEKPLVKEILSLAELPQGKSCTVKEIWANSEETKRLMAFGFLEDTLVESLYQSPSGNPVAYCIRGVVLAIREEDARKIIIK